MLLFGAFKGVRLVRKVLVEVGSVGGRRSGKKRGCVGHGQPSRRAVRTLCQPVEVVETSCMIQLKIE